MQFYEIENTGLSTVNAALAGKHKSCYPAKKTTVACMMIDVLLERHAPTAIHFLKIDVEGNEDTAFRNGRNFQREGV